jgi:hypothetical protein
MKRRSWPCGVVIPLHGIVGWGGAVGDTWAIAVDGSVSSARASTRMTECTM